jgi:hypothetical protein
LDKEKRHCYRTRKLGLFIEEEFKPKDHLEKCALAKGTHWHRQRTFHWIELPESKTLVFTGTRKPGN